MPFNYFLSRKDLAYLIFGSYGGFKDLIWFFRKKDGESRRGSLQDRDGPLPKERKELEIERLRSENDSLRLMLSYRNQQLDRILENLSRIKGHDAEVQKIEFMLDEDRSGRFDAYLKMIAVMHNSSFTTALVKEFPSLTKTDVELCYWLRMGMDTNAIAEMTFRSPGTVKVRRSKLRKKLGLYDREQSLSLFLEMFAETHSA